MPSIGESLLLTRSDLAGFPEESIKYVLNLQKEKGWRGKRSNRSHVAMLSPDGQISCGLSTNPDGLRWLKRDVNRYYAAKGEEEKPVKEKVSTQKVTCPRPDCPKAFNSLENLDVHINVDHEGKIKCPECKETFKDNRAVGRHRGLKHGYVSPRYAARKQQEANRAKKSEEVAGDLNEEQTEQIDAYMKESSPLIKNHILRHADETVKEEIDRFENVGTIIDSMPTEHLIRTEDQISFKDLAKKFNPVSTEDVENSSDSLSIEDVLYGTTSSNPRLPTPEELSAIFDGDIVDPEPKEEDHVDDRESWVLDMSMVMDVTVETVLKNMYAAGLGMEIRVWREN